MLVNGHCLARERNPGKQKPDLTPSWVGVGWWVVGGEDGGALRPLSVRTHRHFLTAPRHRLTTPPLSVRTHKHRAGTRGFNLNT